MRIALCDYVSSYSKAYQFGGVQVKMFEKAHWLMERGHDVTVYASPLTFGPRLTTMAEHMKGVPYFEGWRQTIKADVAYVWYYSPLAWRFLFSVDCPKVAGLHAPGLLARSSYRHHLFRTIGSQDMAAFDAVRIVNKVFKFHHRRVFHIPDWVDIGDYHPQENRSQKFTVLFVGRAHGGKGWDDFAQMAHILIGRGYDFDFVATGEGNGVVRGLGRVDRKDMPEVYSRAHVLAYPAWADTFGIVIIEAMASGVPVITTPSPAHTRLELPMEYATVAEEFADKVVKVHGEWAGRREQYEADRAQWRQAVTKFDAETVLPSLEKMLTEVAHREERAVGPALSHRTAE